ESRLREDLGETQKRHRERQCTAALNSCVWMLPVAASWSGGASARMVASLRASIHRRHGALNPPPTELNLMFCRSNYASSLMMKSSVSFELPRRSSVCSRNRRKRERCYSDQRPTSLNDKHPLVD